MARRRRNRSERDHNTIATEIVHPTKLTLPRLNFFDDARQFSFDEFLEPLRFDNWRPAILDRNVNQGRSRPVSRRYQATLFQADFPVFDRPLHVSVCIRRKQRREVLFAKKRTRSGRGGRRRRNKWSDVSCR